MTQLGISPKKDKYRHMVLQEAEKYTLDDSLVKVLARHLGIPLSAPSRFARGWSLSICKLYISAK